MDIVSGRHDVIRGGWLRSADLWLMLISTTRSEGAPLRFSGAAVKPCALVVQYCQQDIHSYGALVHRARAVADVPLVDDVHY